LLLFFAVRGFLRTPTQLGRSLDGKENYGIFMSTRGRQKGEKRTLTTEKEAQEHRNHYAGFYELLTNDIKDSLQALMVYRNKETIKNALMIWKTSRI